MYQLQIIHKNKTWNAHSWLRYLSVENDQPKIFAAFPYFISNFQPLVSQAKPELLKNFLQFLK